MEECNKFWEYATDVFETTSKAISQLSAMINKKAFKNCVEVLDKCKGKIITSGAGTSGAAAKKIAHSLSCIDQPAFFLSPSDALHGALGSVEKNDVIILISKGGKTPEINNMLPSLKAKGAYIIGVTENEKSILAKESNLLIKIKVEKEADPFNMLATTSTAAVITVFDAICIVLINQTKFTKRNFLILHPGGAVGKRLSNEQ